VLFFYFLSYLGFINGSRAFRVNSNMHTMYFEQVISPLTLHLPPISFLPFKNKILWVSLYFHSRCWCGCGKNERLDTVGENINWYNHYENQDRGSSIYLKSINQHTRGIPVYACLSQHYSPDSSVEISLGAFTFLFKCPVMQWYNHYTYVIKITYTNQFKYANCWFTDRHWQLVISSC
jgi:hypothetical protein